MIRDRIVCGTSDSRVKEKLLQAETLDLPKAINIAWGIEISTHQMKDLTVGKRQDGTCDEQKWAEMAETKQHRKY